jgi:hypothetical protein
MADITKSRRILAEYEQQREMDRIAMALMERGGLTINDAYKIAMDGRKNRLLVPSDGTEKLPRD